MTNSVLLLWSDSLAVSAAIWLLISTFILYLGRKQAHQVFNTTGRALYRTFRSWAFTLGALEKRVSARNKQVLLHNGERDVEKAIEREFERVHNIVQRDLSQYPALHRQVRDVIEKVEVDYQNAADAAPLPPAWKDVVETITSIPPSGDPAVNKILQNIKNAVEDSHTKTLKLYKQASAQRHKLLADMRPDWRAMQVTLEQINSKVKSIDERAQEIDHQMETYKRIKDGEDRATASLSASAFTQFFISGLVLVVAGLGGLINFQLIAMPMSEMVGGASYIGDMKTSDIAALVIILIEIAMGLFLVESLKITHLFPIVSSMDDRLRKRMFYITLAILTILACIEASLAYMRDLLALDREALNQALTGAGVSESAIQAQFRWIPSVGQMIMGFILPFALAFIAIPMESFIQSTRIVLGALAVGVLRAFRVTVRMLGGLCKHGFMVLTHLYDIAIVVPLGIERIIRSASSKTRDEHSEGSEHESNLQSSGSSERVANVKIKRSTAKSKTKNRGDFDDVNLADTLA